MDENEEGPSQNTMCRVAFLHSCHHCHWPACDVSHWGPQSEIETFLTYWTHNPSHVCAACVTHGGDHRERGPAPTCVIPAGGNMSSPRVVCLSYGAPPSGRISLFYIHIMIIIIYYYYQ